MDNLVADIATLKKCEITQPLHIRASDGSLVGTLQVINRETAGRPEIIKALHDWRKAHMTSFLTVFEPSLPKTEHFLQQVYLPDPCRILFLVREVDRFIGHLGFKLDAEVELDNVLRGETSQNPKLMHLAQITSLAWAFGDQRVRRVILKVLAHNSRAIRAYRGAGFSPSSTTNLVRVPFEGGYTLTPTTGSTSIEGSEQLLSMELTRSSFERMHSWALS